MSRSAPSILAVLALAIPLTSCGSAGVGSGAGGTQGPDPERSADGASTTSQGSDEGGTWLTASGDVLVSCYAGPPFPVSVLEQVEVGSDEAADIVNALSEVKEEGGMDAPESLQDASAAEVRWTVLYQASRLTGEEMGLLVAEPGTTDFSLERDEFLVLGQHDGHWMVESWGGGCRAQLALDRSSAWAQVAWPEGSEEQSGSSIEVLVSETECASARDPEPFLAAEPHIVETEEDVTVYWTSERVLEGADCPGNPWVERTLQLETDLGERALLDGSTWPPLPVGPVEER